MVLQRVEGLDALTITLIKSEKGKYLLAGSARENALYAYEVVDSKLSDSAKKLLELPSANEHIRKIKVRGQNMLELQTIPFSYTLIAETSNSKERNYYEATWNSNHDDWTLVQK